MRTIPNLDCMSQEELLNWNHENSGSKDVATCVATCYAVTKSSAIEARMKGDIQHALTLENQCDKLYDMLPEESRW